MSAAVFSPHTILRRAVAVLVVTITASCAQHAATPSSSSRPAAKRAPSSGAGTARLRPPASPGCGSTAEAGPTSDASATGDVPGAIAVNHRDRTYRLAVPARYDPRRATPLILLFHGSGSNAVRMSAYTQLPRRAAARGYLVATPDAINGQWTVSAADAKTPDHDFVVALIDTLSKRFCVDPARVYAAGFSLGSGFTAITGCGLADRIAAIGLASAEFLLPPCRRTLPVMAFHGTSDPAVAYADGGQGASFPGVRVRGVERNMGDWARLDGCRARPVVHHVGREVIRRTWPGCRAGAEVILFTVVGGGHTWPGSPIPNPVAGVTTTQVSATGQLLDFFGRHRLIPTH